MEDFDDFIGRDLAVFGVDQAFIEKLKWMDQFVKAEVRFLVLAMAAAAVCGAPSGSAGRRRSRSQVLVKVRPGGG